MGASVVVATVGRADRLPALVDAVLADPAAAELVVVVDGADPESERVLASLAADRPRLRVLHAPHRGQHGAFDLGVAVAHGEVVVFLDDDVVPGPGLVSGHVAHHARQPGLVVVGPMPVEPHPGASAGTRLYAAEYLEHLGHLERGETAVLDALWGGNFSVRRVDCLRVGLRSEQFRVHYHADWDLGYRMAQAGLVGVYDPALGALHRHRRTDPEFLRDAERQGAGRVALHRSHPDRLGPFGPQLVVAGLPPALGAVVRLLGPTPLARPAARVLMGAGRVAARAGRDGVGLRAAKLARRIMQWHGAARALRAPAGTPPTGRAAAVRPS